MPSKTMPSKTMPSTTRRSTSARSTLRKRRFSTTLWRYPGKGGWTFARIPQKAAPPITRGWGRTPVRATVDGQSWDTSVWRSKDGGAVLPVPKHIRGDKGDGDSVRVEIAYDPED